MKKLTALQLLMINRNIMKNNNISNTIMQNHNEVAEMLNGQNERELYQYGNTAAQATRFGCSIAGISPFKNYNQAVPMALLLLKLIETRLTEYKYTVNSLLSSLNLSFVKCAHGLVY